MNHVVLDTRWLDAWLKTAWPPEPPPETAGAVELGGGWRIVPDTEARIW